VVGYHTNSSPGLPFVLMYQPSGPPGNLRERVTWDRSRELATAFGLTVVRGAPTPNTLAGAALLDGKPALTVEIPSPRMLSVPLVTCALRGTTNLLAFLEMVDRPVETQAEAPPIPG